MIRVRLLTEKEHMRLWREAPGYKTYDDSCFYALLREKGEFSDEESLALLRHLHGEAFVTGKWYRCTTADGKPCIPAISREAMYGLVVIENSRKGLYTNLEKDFLEFEVESRMKNAVGRDLDIPLVWQVFAKMDLEILLTFRIKDFGFAADIPIDEEFILENYPINGVPTEVRVVSEHLRQPELRDGKWYIHNYFYDQKYRWYNNPEEILELIRDEFMGCPPLVKGVFPLDQFEEMCCPRLADNGLSRLRQMGYERQEVNRRGIPYEEETSPWKVVNHMDYLPADGDSRRLLYLIIEEYSDGHFCLRDEVSVKYPTYDEMLGEARDLKKPDCEAFMLPIDVNECMDCAVDIYKAVCAFRVTEDIIETFDREEGLREFEKQLRRAVESGNITKPENN